MITVNDKQLYFQATFPVMDGETVLIDIPSSKGPVPLSITFVTGKGGSEVTATWRMENGKLIMEFQNWKNSLGNSIQKPVRIGDIDGVPLGFQVINHHMSGLNLVNLFFFKGGKYE